MKSHLLLCSIILLAFVACATTNWHGFQAAVSVDTSKAKQMKVEQAKKDLITYIESLGFEKAEPSPHHVEPPDYLKFAHPKHNAVFYNLYLNEPEKIYILIRDVRRTYSDSRELREEIEGLLNILKKYFGSESVRFEQQSTFLS